MTNSYYSVPQIRCGNPEQRSFKKTLLMFWLFALFMFISVNALAQKNVRGKVITDGEGMAGVSVTLKGSTLGVSTDVNGSYIINVPQDNAVLVFKMISYATQEVAVGNQTIINVALISETKNLEEVVVVGYGVQSRRDLTGSIAKIDNKVLSTVPVGSFDAALQGRAAGVQVTQSTGMAGSGTQIRIRGAGSITAGGEPLYVIDGIPIPSNSGQTLGASNVNPLATINPGDIESIEILKDASSAAIYGSRGANGVILITTKRGAKGKPKINFSTRAAFSNITRRPELLTSQEQITLFKEAVDNDFKYGPAASNNTATKPLPGGVSEADALKTNTDWQDETIHTGFSSFNDLSLSAGSDKLLAYIGVSYTDEKSFLVNDDFKRYSARANLDYTPFKALKIGTNLSFAYTDQNNIPVGYDGGYGRAISAIMPYFPVYNEDGSFYKPSGFTNPVAEIFNKTRQSRRQRTLASLFTDLKIIKDLSLRLEGTLDYSDNSVYQLTTQVLTTNPTSNQSRNYLGNWNTKAFLNYSLDIKDSHRFKFLLGTELLKSINNSNNHTVRFTPGEEDWLYNNPVLPPLFNPNGTPNTDNRKTFNPASAYSFISYYARINYSLKDRYMLTGTIRRDGSSRFGVNNKFGTFPALSLGWIVTEEGFIQKINALSYLKLKAGFGLTGNAEISNNAQWGTTNVSNTQLYNGMQYYTVGTLANPDIKWETTKKYDIGLEYGFIKNRISGELNYYINDASDLFLNVSTTTSTGYGSVLANIGKLRNRGIEFNINSKNIIRSNFTWTTDFNISRNTNKVLDIGNAGPDALGGQGDIRVITGQPIGSNYLVKTLYIDPADGLPVYEMLDPVTHKPAGTTKTYNAQRDRQVVGHPYPDFFGGIDNQFTWKNFDFGFTGTFQVGGNIYDDAEKFQLGNIGSWNAKADVLKRWQKPGDVTTIPRLSNGLGGFAVSRNTTEFLHDASYFRMKVVSIGYRLPKSLLNKVYFSNARIGFSVSNIFTISKYDGDPEIFRDAGSSQNRNLSPNVTYLTPPQSRSYMLSLNLNF